MIACATGAARGDALRPVTSHLGWRVDLDGFLQVDWVTWSQRSQDELDPGTLAPLNEQSIYIRRALLRADARKDDWHAMVELAGDTVAGASAGVSEAWLEWAHGDAVKIQGGLLDIPFGVLVATNARYRDFLEQPTFLRALFPGDRDAGLHASGAFGLARWSLALMDGAPTKDLQWKGRDPSSSYDVIARVAAVVTSDRPLRVEAGVTGLVGDGFHAGTPATKDQLVWVDSNNDGIVQPTELQDIPGMVATASQSFRRDAIAVDASLRFCLRGLGPGTVSVEGAIAKNLDRGVVYADPIANARDLREVGFDAAWVQELGRHALAGVRFDYYDGDQDALARAGLVVVNPHKLFTTLSVMAAARWQTVRVIAQYDHATNPFGLATNGMPTTLGADRVTVRGQVEF